MRLKLKEEPAEWQKFTLVMLTLCSGLNLLLWYKGLFPTLLYRGLFLLLAAVATWCLVKPRAFRGLYRNGMTVSHAIGQVMGKVLLTLFFFLALTPLALLMRLMGKDPLQIYKKGDKPTYWCDSRERSRLDRMF